jgi:outer membrane protein OmpA-like peptidoglycan-associated protein
MSAMVACESRLEHLHGTSRMTDLRYSGRILLAAVALLFDARDAASQQFDATPLDVWYACRHPQLAQHPKARFLCEKTVLPWGPSQQQENQKANWLIRDSIPAASDVKKLALEAVRPQPIVPNATATEQPDAILGALSMIIPFRPDSVEIDPDRSRTLLEKMAAQIVAFQRRNPADTVFIVGGADPTGMSPLRNQLLAERRAIELKTALLESNGDIDWHRLMVKGQPAIKDAKAMPADATPALLRQYEKQRVAGIQLPPAFVNDVLAVSPVEAVPQPAAPLTTLAPSEIGTAFANALTNRAVFQVKAFAYGEALKRFCDDSVKAASFQVTCQVARNFTAQKDWRQAPTPADWRMAMVADLSRLLGTLDATQAGTPAAEAVGYFRIAAQVRDSMQAGQSTARALAGVLRSRTCAGDCVPHARIALLAGAIAEAAETLRFPEGTTIGVRDTVLLYAARTLAVHGDSRVNVATALDTLSRLMAVGELIDRLQREASTDDQAKDATRLAKNAEVLLQLLAVIIPADKVTPALRQALVAYDAARTSGNLRAMWTILATTLPQKRTEALDRLLPLAVELATAPDAAAFQGAVERYILGARGTAYKYSRTDGGLHLTVNSYVGVGSSWPGGLQLFLPIGLEVGRGGLCRCGTGYFGLLLHPIDIGALSALQLNQAKNPPTSASQLLTPGVSLIAAPWRHPFVAGIGTTFRQDGDRRRRDVRLFVAVDIPLFP